MAISNEKPEVKTPNEWDKFLEGLPFEKRLEVLSIQRQNDFINWCQENEINNPNTLWAKRYDSLFSPQSSDESQEKPKEERDVAKHRRRHLPERPLTYEEFQNQTKENAEKEANEWVKNPNYVSAANRDDAYTKSITNAHDKLVNENEALVNEWVKKHNDTLLARALDRKRLERERKDREKTSQIIQQAQRSEARKTNFSRSRSRLSSFLRKESRGIPSASTRFAKRTISRPILRVPGVIAKATIPRLISLLARTVAVLSRVIVLISAVIFSPVGVLILFFLVIFILLIFLFTFIGSISPRNINSTNPPIKSPYPGIGYSVYGPSGGIRGQSFTHNVELVYDMREATCALENITIVDMIPSGIDLVPEQTTGKFTATPETVKWKLSPENTPYSESSIVKFYRFEIVFNSKDNLTAQNGIYIEGCGDPIIPDIKKLPPPGDDSDQTGLYEGADSLPTTNTCNKYGGIIDDIQKDFPKMTAANYGDPVCSYSEAKFKKVIELTEKNPENIDFWLDIADCESGSPNGFVPADDGGGTWGRFQMRRGFPNPGKPWSADANDRGDVPWQKQIENAINYNNSLKANGTNFGYWGTAMCLCYYDKYKNQPYCNDIVRNGDVRSPITCDNSCTANKGR